ncbi:hypothetical protein QN372_06945 [Undibacterium sp. RTI2.1]|uniref:hypothetical protein n=1 Tax=unclassified Undibacterium TaxID=2630295 RepID=UPI002AB343AE|nr:MULTISPECIES: hypothetical protein [unclassified Undibacterium]MDY7536990.1 hypothetical protein [Undibacterium sp. 5I1]MEB0030473.1 hypothetical protein [Undibacterium sp. RTI2.1]MEB0115256.1 hypothetical protein [Undibacterium sp. RTI2.2]MEB0231329.1 hypothetical protein [Undibacterium sp. 10I3]MEB0258742.1 hypothetical protein [Undibacterium sp. 5I1]
MTVVPAWRQLVATKYSQYRHGAVEEAVIRRELAEECEARANQVWLNFAQVITRHVVSGQLNGAALIIW